MRFVRFLIGADLSTWQAPLPLSDNLGGNKGRSRVHPPQTARATVARALLDAWGMEKRQEAGEREHGGRAKQTVLVIGGSGGMSNRYRDVVESHGLALRHYENRLPPGARRTQGSVGLVIVMVSMVSHSLRDQAQNLAGVGASIVYLRSASVSALRSAVEQWAA
jgi:hypothetical protein